MESYLNAYGSSKERSSTNKSRRQTLSKVFSSEEDLDQQFVRIDYIADDDQDAVDKMLEKFIRESNITVPIKRLFLKQYLFGTKMIHAKIRNGKLQVRVGGGYMSIGEFVDKHSSLET